MWIELTDTETGEKRTLAIPAADEDPVFVDFWRGEFWLRTGKDRMLSFTRTSGEAVEQRWNDWVLYRLPADGSEFLRVAQADRGFVFGGDAVYYTRTESEYLGTKPMPTGRPGEMVDSDFFETKTVAVGFWKDGGITEINPNLPEGFENLSLTVGADGILYGGLSDGGRTYWETGETNAVSCALDPETIEIIRTYEGVQP